MKMDKKAVRAQMRQLNRSLDSAARAEASEKIFTAVAATDEFSEARCIALFCSLPDEPDTAATIAAWRAAGRRIVVPRVEGDVMRLFDYDPATQVAGAFGIEEPGPDARLCPVGDVDLMVVPGVAFTSAGDRMGRGRGYYDKYLSLSGFRAAKIGVCYAHQIVDSLPTEPHDIRMDRVIFG